jgi:pimeloyl-ACP methyl ester carboxylesterase
LFLTTVLLVFCPIGACAGPPETPGLVIVVGGIGGVEIIAPGLRWLLPHLGVHHEVRNFVWTHGTGKFMQDLQDAPHVIEKANELAALIRQAKTEAPQRPIYLIGKSGGAGLSLLAAEQLPPQTLERIILLNAAVTPNYDLRLALRATRAEVVSFYSPCDWLVLGWGTRQFGTIDRVHTASAGLYGFSKPPNLSPEDRVLYQRLVQVSWSPTMICEGYPGGHLGTSLPGFVGKEVVPWLRP